MKDPVLHQWIIEKNPDALEQWIDHAKIANDVSICYTP